MSEGPVVPKAVDHSGFIVSDMERSIAFYQEMFGAEIDVRADVGGLEIAAMQGVDQHVDFSLAYVRFANTKLELIEYREPEALPLVPVHQIGAGHLGLLYDDVETAYRDLSDRGMTFFSDPLHIEEGPAAGWVVVYGQDPDGNRIELLQRS